MKRYIKENDMAKIQRMVYRHNRTDDKDRKALERFKRPAFFIAQAQKEKKKGRKHE